MKTTLLLLSPTETTISLQAIAYCLVKCRPLLSDYEKEVATEFVTSLAENMAKSPEGLITISLSLTTLDVITALHVQNELYAVLDALKSENAGGLGTYNSEHWKKTAHNTSQGTSLRNTPPLKIIEGEKNHLPE